MSTSTPAREIAPAPSGARAAHLIFWRIANPAFAGLIGFVLAQGVGAAFGAVGGLLLSFAPELSRGAWIALGRFHTWVAPHLRTAGGRIAASLPGPLLRALSGQERS